MHTTEAIVLTLQKHNDSASIAHLYTLGQGRMQCLVYGRKNSFTPLSWLDITFRQRSGTSMPYMSSSSLHYVPQNIYSDIKRQCLAIFIAETVYRTIKHPMQDERIFSFLTSALLQIDLSDSVDFIPKAFLTSFSELLGYGGEMLEEWNNLKSLDLVS